MNHLSLTLLVILFSSALVSCKKKTESVKSEVTTQQPAARVSGTHAATNIVWEDTDLK